MNSLHTRLLVAVTVVALAAAAAIAFSARQTTRIEFQRFQEVQRRRESGDAEALGRVAAALQGQCCDAVTLAAGRAVLAPGQVLLVLDDRGVLAGQAGADAAAPDLRVSFADEVLKIEATSSQPGSVAGMTVLLKGEPSTSIAMRGGRAGRLFVVPLPDSAQQPASQFLGSVDRRLIGALALVAVLAVAVSWGVARRIVKPIAELRDATRDLSRGDFSRRVSTAGADELADLGRGFNAMAAELERQQTLRRDLVHDVAHELRTPLTALRCRLETAIDGLSADPGPALQRMHEEVTHLSQLVSDLEELARAEAREIALSIGDVSLPDICRSATSAAALEQDPRLHLELGGRVVARADAVRARQIVLNLLTNADRHTPAGGAITLRAIVRDGEAIVEVHNTGSSLAPEELARVFDRFYRADPSRQRATGGSGLGLAIVKHLVEAMGGRTWALSDATGVTVGVAFPGQPGQSAETFTNS